MDQEDYIIDYLSGTLETDAKRSFEKRLKVDPEFAAEVEQYKAVYADMEVFRDYQKQKAEVDEVVQGVEAELRGKLDDSVGSDRLGKRKIRWWGIAATLALLVISTYFILPKYGPTYFQGSYPGLIENPGALRGESQDDQIFLDALTAYETGDYILCIILLGLSPETSSEKVLLGSAQLLNAKPDRAINSLQSVLSDPDFLEYARWLLALSHLHKGEEESARKYLQEIIDDPSRRYKKSEAESILRNLDRFWR